MSTDGQDVFESDSQNEGIPQAGIVFDDDTLTAEDFKKLLERGQIPEGQYASKVIGYKRLAPTEEKAGGDLITFQVVQPPPGVAMPDGGWKPVSRLFRQFIKPNDGQKTSQRIDKEARAEFLKACGLEITTSVSVPEALAATVGSMVFFSAVNRKGKDDQPYQDIKFFKPYSERPSR